MSKKWAIALASVFCLAACAPVTASLSAGLSAGLSASADGVSLTDTYTETFDDPALLDSLSITKENEGNAVRIEDGVLKIDNVKGITEVSLPVTATDFVFEFDCKRTAEQDTFTDKKRDGVTNGIMDPDEESTTVRGVRHTSVLLKYRTAEDGTGFESRIHSAQKDVGGEHPNGEWSNSNYTAAYLDETTGHGLEQWYISEKDIAAGKNNGKMTMFNYYSHELYLNETYTFRLQVSGNLMELYVNGEKFLKDLLEEQSDGTGFALALDSEITSCSAQFDNIRAYTPSAYVEKMIAELPEIEADQTEETVQEYVKALENVQTFGASYVGTDFVNVENYATYAEKEAALESTYQLKLTQKPALTVAWKDVAYETESRVKLPVASAVDVKGNKLAVSVKVKFNDKFVKVEDNAFIANEAGEYTVIYTAHDVKGNETTEEHTVSVTEKLPTENVDMNTEKPNYLLFGIATGVLVAVVAGYVVLFFVLRRKKK